MERPAGKYGFMFKAINKQGDKNEYNHNARQTAGYIKE